MKPSLFVFGLIISAQICVIKGHCYFKNSDGTDEYYPNNCECGLDKKPFQPSDAKYCCVPSKSTCDESQRNTKWCAAGKLLTKYQACNGSCMDLNQRICQKIETASFTSDQCYTKGWTAEDEYSVILI